jgi:hypothetical protein
MPDRPVIKEVGEVRPLPKPMVVEEVKSEEPAEIQEVTDVANTEKA